MPSVFRAVLFCVSKCEYNSEEDTSIWSRHVRGFVEFGEDCCCCESYIGLDWSIFSTVSCTDESLTVNR